MVQQYLFNLMVKQYESFYNTATEDYVSSVITYLSPQAVDSPKDSAILKSTGVRTEQFLLFVNNDGSIGAFTGHRNEKLAGWVIWQTDGKFISVTGITSFLYVVTERTINGATKYYLEQLSNSMFSPTDCSVSKTLSGSHQHGAPKVNGAVTSTRQLVIDGFTKHQHR